MFKGNLPRGEALRSIRDGVARTRESSLFRSSEFQVALTVLGPRGLHISIRRIDREPLLSRDDMVAVANVFAPEGTVPVELYPAESRVVDTANQYHAFCLPIEVGDGVTLHDVCRHLANGRAVDGGEWTLHGLPVGSSRDWRAAMRRKAELLGAEAEAIDILSPESLGYGLCLMANQAPGYRFPFGFEHGARSDGSAGLSVQRAGSGERGATRSQ